MIYPNRIKEIREEAGISQVLLAAKADLSPTLVNKLDQGFAKLTEYNAERIANALNVSVGDLECNRSAIDAKLI